MDYTIASQHIRIADELLTGHFARALAPFAAAKSEQGHTSHTAETATESRANSAADAVLRAGANQATGAVLDIVPGPCPAAGPGYRELSAFDLPDADAACRLGVDGAGYLLEMRARNGMTGRMRIDGSQAVTDITHAHPAAMLRFGAWLAYNIAAAPLGSVALHASAIVCQGQAVLFLGESGTGKSTHTRLWREHIPGSGLLNDDSPVVTMRDGVAVASGSPWSGKTPCYRNEGYPLRALVRLTQGPENRIRRLKGIEAVGALISSAPPALAHDGRLQDDVWTLLSGMLACVPVYRLACKPDAEAARLAFETIFNNIQQNG